MCPRIHVDSHFHWHAKKDFMLTSSACMTSSVDRGYFPLSQLVTVDGIVL